MPRVVFDSEPVFIKWVVNRGTTNADAETMPIYFANPGGYTITQLGDGAEEVTITDPLDVTGRTYSGKVVIAKGGAALCGISVIDADQADGELALSLARADLIAYLPVGFYIFDLVENIGGDESTIIVGSLVVQGRATP